MGKSADRDTGRAAELVDELRAQQQVLGQAQARRAELMMEFSEVRYRCDRRVITEAQASGVDARYRSGEFGAMEIGLAVRESKYSFQKVLGMSRRLRSEAPDSWDAWLAGDIDQDKAIRINRALRLLVRDESKQLLNDVVVDVAVCKTPELLGRWLNQFIARIEPDQSDERTRRTLSNRYVSVRPDADGVSLVHAMMSSVDAVAIDQVLTAVAALAEPGDPRNLQQRRADALVDMLLGRISNGCATRWDTNSDAADDDDSVEDEGQGDNFSVDDGSVDDDGQGGNSAVDDDSVDGDGQGRERALDDESVEKECPVSNSTTDRVPADRNPADGVPAELLVPDNDDRVLPASAYRPDPPIYPVAYPAPATYPAHRRARRRAWILATGHPRRASTSGRCR